MCGRFSLITDSDHLHAYYGVVNAEQFTTPRFNIAPSQNVTAVISTAGERRLEQLHWGLIPHWAKEKKLKYSTINARAESVESKPAYRAAFRQRRCVIPADGFYEWQGEAGHKRPWRIEPAERGGLFSFAGLWETWEGEGEVIRSCTIIVGDANEQVREIHSRMPILLGKEQLSAWLDPGTPLEAIRPMLATPSHEALRIYRIDSYVNNPRHEDPRCLQPAAEE
jgi:putative SOS response-associated peptidase YedK